MHSPRSGSSGIRGLGPPLALALVCSACAGIASCSAGSPAPLAPEVVARPPLARLTHAQYDNTIRDLLGITAQPSAAFAEDEEQAGYAANTTLPVQELQLGQYEQAAEALASQAVTGHYAALVPCSPTPPSNAAACADRFVRTFGKRAFRRPLAEDEVAAYTGLLSSAGGSAGGGFVNGVRTVVAAMLQSPNFLYRLEWGTPGAAPESDGAIALSPYEVASRLSYFLWNTMPDDELLAAADTGHLTTADEVTAEAHLMLQDPKARDALASFHTQWLGLQGLATLEKTDPAFTTELRSAMSDEVVAFVDGVVREGDGRLESLLTADFSYLEGPLYGVYGVAPPSGASSSPARVALPSNRAGVLTLPAVLATHAHADDTSIVHRGLLVLEQLLCSDVPPPPPNVDTTVPPASAALTQRQFLEEHATNPGCATCHTSMDAIGDAFEEFDSIRAISHDGGRPTRRLDRTADGHGSRKRHRLQRGGSRASPGVGRRGPRLRRPSVVPVPVRTRGG